VDVSNIVRAALVQTEWTGDKESMIEKNIDMARKAAADGAQILCFQEIFSSRYFCTTQDPQYYDEAEEIPDGPTMQRMIALARETGIVLVVPIYEKVDEGTFYNTAAVIDADGTFLGIYRKTHIPQVAGFWEKFYFKPGNTGYPVFDTAVGRIGVYICYDRHFPEGWRALGLAGAKIVFNPSATTRGHSKYLWELEQTAAAVANEFFVGAINRVGAEGLEDTDYYGTSYFASPRGQIIEGTGSDTTDDVVIRDLDMGMIEEVRRHWAFYRDRRPETYASLSE
jgi:N-carbamoylputrescine amidase